MSRLPLAVVGVGHLGKEHARILATLPDVDLVGVVDANRGQAETIAARCNTQAYTDHRELVGQVRGAVIAAPTVYHHGLAIDFLRAGVPLLVEKPITSTREQARELVAVAQKTKTILQVGHIERFNPAFEELAARPLHPGYVRCERLSGFSGRSTDVGVVLDLMIHDIDLVLSLVRADVTRVDALGVAVLGGHEDMAQARLTFADGCVADLTASRVQPEPRRQMQVWAAEGYAGVDFARRHLTRYQPGAQLRSGTIDSRRLDPTLLASLKSELFTRHIQVEEIDCSRRHASDQLTRELEAFVHCVRCGATPRVDGHAGSAALDVACRVLDGVAGRAASPVRAAA